MLLIGKLMVNLSQFLSKECDMLSTIWPNKRTHYSCELQCSVGHRKFRYIFRIAKNTMLFKYALHIEYIYYIYIYIYNMYIYYNVNV